MRPPPSDSCDGDGQPMTNESSEDSSIENVGQTDQTTGNAIDSNSSAERAITTDNVATGRLTSESKEAVGHAPSDGFGPLTPGDDAPVLAKLVIQENRLHGSTIWLPAVEAIIGGIVPAVIGSLFIGPFAVLWFATCFVLLPALAYHTFRYYTLSYLVGADELVIRSGLLSRRERRIPLDRVQEVQIHQGILYQLLRLAKLEITTAGKDSQGANLNVLSLESANDLKLAITAKQRDSHLPIDRSKVEQGETADYTCQIDLKTLLVGGLTSKVVATLGAIVGAIVYFQIFLRVGGNWFDPVSDQIKNQSKEKFRATNPGQAIEQLEDSLPSFLPFDFGVDFLLDETLAKSVLLAIGGLAIAVGGYAIRYFNFRLERCGDVLTTSHGLLTLRQGSLARNRIQALKLEEGLLRRWLGLAAVRVDSAGDRNQVDENKNRDVLVPVASRELAHEVACEAIPGLNNLDPTWHRISRLAILRGSKKGWLLATLVTIQTYFTAGWFCLAWLPAFPLVYVLNYQWYRISGYSLGGDYFLWRSGWLNRSTVCLPVRNIQNASVTQNPFDRRLGLATLSLDIAGQSNTGGGPRIKHLPVDEAKQLLNELTSLAADSEFVW